MLTPAIEIIGLVLSIGLAIEIGNVIGMLGSRGAVLARPAGQRLRSATSRKIR